MKLFMKNRRPSLLSLAASGARLAALTVAAVALAAPSCAHDSYIVVQMRSAGDVLIGFTEVTVTVADSVTKMPMVTRTFTVPVDGGLAIDATTGKTFSLSFTPDRSGTVDLAVTACTGTGCAATGACMASGTQLGVRINKGGTTSTTVALSPSSSCGTTDAGAPDGKVTFVGCAPAQPGSCPASQTCYVDCTAKQGVCVPGGTRAAGEACNSNSDCMAGTQCFDYACGANTKYCLKFCNADADCAGSTTVSTASACTDPVVCPPTATTAATTTSYKTCGFTCDPRGDGKKGCPAGLTCFLFSNGAGGPDVPGCGCAGPTRVGTDGAKCAAASDCAPGFLCDQMLGGTFCRRLCQMASPGDCPTGQTCTALQNNATFGVCLAP